MVEGGKGGAGGAGGAEEEGAEERGGEALVGVAIGRGDVVEDPKELLGESGVVGVDGVSAVGEELLHAGGVGDAKVGEMVVGFGGGGEGGGKGRREKTGHERFNLL